MSDLQASGAVSWSRAYVPAVLSTIAKVSIASGFVLTALGVTDLSFLALMASLPLFLLSYAVSLSRTHDVGDVTVRGTELVVTYGAHRSFVRFDDVTSAIVLQRQDSFRNTLTSVEIETTRGDRMKFTPRAPEHARAIVEALGFGRGGRRQRVTLAGPLRRLLHPLLGMLAIGASAYVGDLTSHVALRGVQIGVFLNVLFLLGFYELAKRALRPAVFTVGDDGVAVNGALRRTFVARRDIASVEVPPIAAVVIRHHDRKRTVLSGLNFDRARARAFAGVIEERVPDEGRVGQRANDFGRGELSVAEWRNRLNGRAQADYRSSPPTEEEMLGVLRSAHATADERVGAALAARVAGIPPERIRVAAEATAADRVRIALEAVADDEDDAVLEKAMKRFSR